MDGQVELEEKEEVQAALQTDWRSTETRQIPRDEDDQEEEEELSFTHEEKEVLHLRREERHMEKGVEEEEEEEYKMSEQVDLTTTAASSAAVMSICIFCYSLRWHLTGGWSFFIRHLNPRQNMLETTVQIVTNTLWIFKMYPWQTATLVYSNASWKRTARFP